MLGSVEKFGITFPSKFKKKLSTLKVRADRFLACVAGGIVQLFCSREVKFYKMSGEAAELPAQTLAAVLLFFSASASPHTICFTSRANKTASYAG